MAVSGLSSLTMLHADLLARVRGDLTDLQRQLGTGKKAETYAGLGADRGVAVGLRSSLSAYSAFQSTIDHAKLRLEMMQTTLTRLDAIGRETKSDTVPGTIEILAGGRTAAQEWNQDRLSEMLSILNTQAGDRYLFSGKAGTTRAVAVYDELMEGVGARAGFETVLAERRRADLGAAPAQGRVGVAINAGNTSRVDIVEDGDHPFGFKVAAASTTITGATVAVDVTGQGEINLDLAAATFGTGQTVSLSLDLPDGTTTKIDLTTTTSATPAAGEFQVVLGNTMATAANLRAAIETAIRHKAQTDLTAASALAAGEDFFAGASPMRVSGTPETATTLVAGTAADTMFWYTGEDDGTSDRATMAAKIDTAVSVQFGARANEEAIRWQVQHVAVFATATFDPAAGTSREAYLALAGRLSERLDVPPGIGEVHGIQAEVGGAQSAIKAAEARHTQRIGILETFLGTIEDVDPQEVGAQILQTQTRLQASLQVTAMVSRISLVNYI